MISIIIPVYNLERYIIEALDSVRAQSYADWEAVVVDDCSTDNSRAVVREYLDFHRDSRIRLIWPEVNGGVSKSRNLGVASTTGAWLAFLDGDDVWEAEYLATMMREAEASQAALLYSQVWEHHEETGVRTVSGPSPDELARFPNSLYMRCFYVPTGMICRRDVVETMGGFIEEPALQHVEDWHFMLCCVERSVRIVHVPKPLAIWRRHPGSASLRLIPMVWKVLRMFELHNAYAPARVLSAAKAEWWCILAHLTGRTSWTGAFRYYLRAICVNPWRPGPYLFLGVSIMHGVGLRRLLPRAWHFAESEGAA